MPPGAGALKTYRAKRRFDETPEPAGAGPRVKKKTVGGAYLIQKHDATRLHYDLRLELDGVLLSWAVTKGPSYRTADRRLAVRTEDHPLEYGDFEGTIPPRNYGAGTVMLWDTGRWEPVGDPHEGLAAGKLVFLLHGSRLKGRWGLIRMKPKPKEKRENWLLIKEKDSFANSQEDLLATATTSVVSRRDFKQIAAAKAPSPGTLPAFRPQMLATLVEAPPAGDDWQYEIKFDGYRAQIAADGENVRIYTRSGLDWTEKFTGVAKAVAALKLEAALLDGEIVVLDEAGRSDFSALVAALEGGTARLSCFLFDLLEWRGENLTAKKLTERKATLKQLLGERKADDTLQYSEDFVASAKDGAEKLLAAACARGLEGIIAKRADSAYRAGRGGAWLKIKCRHAQEFLVLGFAASGRGRAFSSLLMGVRENGAIRYAGRVGTGFDERTLASLAKLRDEYRAEKPPAANIPKQMQRNVTWVKPELVANVAFAGWTGDGHIRHGSFLGLRGDKKPAEVVREMPAKQPPKARGEVAGVAISHGDKIVYAGPDISKAEIAAYVSAAAPVMLPFMRGRFITLVRAPAGPEKKTFYQRHPAAGFGPAWRHRIFRNKAGDEEDYIYFEKPEALVAAAQMNALEFHIWGSALKKLEAPDRIVFDLDPDPGVDFSAVKAAAVRLRDVLEALDLASFPLLSGGKGIHVVVPVIPEYEWPVIKAFAREFAARLVADAPGQFVATMSKAKRKGKIFIDHFRNERGATAIAPFSPRARKGGAVAWPLDWAGLLAARAADQVSVRDAAAALARRAAPWADYASARQSLTPAALKALGVADR